MTNREWLRSISSSVFHLSEEPELRKRGRKRKRPGVRLILQKFGSGVIRFSSKDENRHWIG